MLAGRYASAVVSVTGRHEADKENAIPGLEAADSGTNATESGSTSELLEGHLGPNAAERDVAPTFDQQQDDYATHASPLDETTIGRWACRFCETERRKPSGLAVHHATCPDSQFYRKHH